MYLATAENHNNSATRTDGEARNIETLASFNRRRSTPIVEGSTDRSLMQVYRREIRALRICVSSEAKKVRMVSIDSPRLRDSFYSSPRYASYSIGTARSRALLATTVTLARHFV